MSSSSSMSNSTEYQQTIKDFIHAFASKEYMTAVNLFRSLILFTLRSTKLEKGAGYTVGMWGGIGGGFLSGIYAESLRLSKVPLDLYDIALYSYSGFNDYLRQVNNDLTFRDFCTKSLIIIKSVEILKCWYNGFPAGFSIGFKINKDMKTGHPIFEVLPGFIIQKGYIKYCTPSPLTRELKGQIILSPTGYMQFSQNFMTRILKEYSQYLLEHNIGSKFISEYVLYCSIKKSLQGHTVRRHAKFLWLGRQHLDIFIEELNMAIEYQGSQHDRPVDYFGGKNAFLKIKENDSRKKKLCHQHGIKLIEVRPGYDFIQIISEITQC